MAHILFDTSTRDRHKIKFFPNVNYRVYGKKGNFGFIHPNNIQNSCISLVWTTWDGTEVHSCCDIYYINDRIDKIILGISLDCKVVRPLRSEGSAAYLGYHGKNYSFF